MLLELRILSGLHKGACLPLGEHAISIGSSEDADVVLLDAGVATQHVLIEQQCLDRWMLRAVDSAIVDLNGNEVETIEVAPDESARIRLTGTDVWLAIVPPETPWSCGDLLAEDGHARVDPNQRDAVATVPATVPPETPWADGDLLAEDGHACVDPNQRAAVATAPAAARHDPGESLETNSSTSARWARLVTSLTVAVAVALGMTAIWRVASITSKGQERPAASETVASSSSKQNAERAVATLKELLRDRNLEQQVQYRLNDGKLQLDAVLDSNQLIRFEPIVAILKARFSRGLQIETHVSSIEQSLPFRIVQVVAGPIPEVLTDDGHRLFLGDSIDGYTLVAVKNDTITFEGKRHVELPW
ncbi:hypothetical protein WK66_08810 [Burkholderia ubonensis]|uniref:FHA domain-containing protein n=1 Tax=Burkholderia ubonensis TaxID=101571 RepID=UPI000759115F|nr:FHA domain-containing protein [Burkholderia ubonensis]KVU28418.1 hypothetical protein WK66_08810 [Burkholderia ubonensis]